MCADNNNNNNNNNNTNNNMRDFEVVELDPKLLAEKHSYLLLGPSGTGKTHTILTALSDPRRYMDLPESGANLWCFPGASLELQPALEAVLDRSVFKKVTFVSSRIGDCDELRQALNKKLKPK